MDTMSQVRQNTLHHRELFLSKDVEKMQHVNTNGENEEIPRWKKDLYQRRISQEEEEERKIKKSKEINNSAKIIKERNEARNNNIHPDWKEELINRKKEKLINANDPIYLRKLQIQSLRQKLMDEKDQPCWKVQILQTKIEKLQREIEEEVAKKGGSDCNDVVNN